MLLQRYYTRINKKNVYIYKKQKNKKHITGLKY